MQEQAQLNECATNKGDFICSPKKGQKLRKLALWFDLILRLKNLSSSGEVGKI